MKRQDKKHKNIKTEDETTQDKTRQDERDLAEVLGIALQLGGSNDLIP